jgi:hypothetical protein
MKTGFHSLESEGLCTKPGLKTDSLAIGRRKQSKHRLFRDRRGKHTVGGGGPCVSLEGASKTQLGPPFKG